MSLGRRAIVYGVAVAVGFLFAFLLLPRGAKEGSSVVAVQEGAPGAERSTRTEHSAPAVDQQPEEVAVPEGEPGEPKVGRGGNPKAREIAEALSTPAHGLIGKTSPVWVQVRRVLPEGDEFTVWREEVESMLDFLKQAARDRTLDMDTLIEEQLDLHGALVKEDLGDAVAEALEVLASRLQEAQAG